MKLRVVVVFLLFLSGFSLEAQLVTNNNKTPTNLVTNVLTGGGVVVSNVTYIGSRLAIGEFFGASSNIGLDHGIIMSTGSVLDQVDGNGNKNGPVGPNNKGSASTGFALPGDAQLAAIYGGVTTKDAAVLEFDFVPEGDTVKFRYVFASEEYPEYVGTVNNDAFAFFISGPGIAGQKNIALLPGGTTPVSINNVNGGFNNVGGGNNSSYYINNGNGSSGTSQATNSTVVNYDGFTVVLEAVSKVVPCQSYHLKIVISDAGVDDLYDSGVFLEANSLNSEPKFKLEQAVDYAPTNSSVEIFEGCSSGELKISRSSKLFETLTIPFRVIGTAVEGADFTAIPHSVTFNPGETDKTVTITPIRDVITEGVETVILRFKNPSVCETDSVDIIYSIKDQPSLTSYTDTVNVICSGDQATLSANANGGVPNYTFNWSTGQTGSSVTVTAQNSAFYTYTITDACSQSKTDSVYLQVPVYPLLTIQPIQDTTIKCKGEVLNFKAVPQGGAGGYTYKWNSGETASLISKQIINSATVVVEVSDRCNAKTTETADVTLNYPEFEANAGPDQQVCVGGSGLIMGTATGGYLPYQYFWEGVAVNPYAFTANEDVTIELSVYDSCGIIPAKDNVFIDTQQPRAQFNISADVPEPREVIVFQNYSIGAVNYYWDLGNEITSLDKNVETSYPEAKEYFIQLIAEDALGCTDTLVQELTIIPPFYFYLPNSFTPNGDGKNDEFLPEQIGVTEFSMLIYNKWGELIFSSQDVTKGWDGNLVPTGVYVVEVKAKSSLRQDKLFSFTKTVTLIR